MNNYKTIQIETKREVLFLRINRPEANNSINHSLVAEISKVLELAEKDASLKVVVLEGNEHFFCSGMDFKDLIQGKGESLIGEEPYAYYDLLRQIAFSSKIIVSKIEGKVLAGGVGLVAACDIVLASEKVTFGLSEALFGLLPACVMPFLIKRVGIQKAQWLALTTQTISAKRAYEIGLVDELSSDISDALRRNLLRLTRLNSNTILDLKNYTAKLWIINDETRQLAVEKFVSLTQSDTVQNNIKNFVEKGTFPWSK